MNRIRMPIHPQGHAPWQAASREQGPSATTSGQQPGARRFIRSHPSALRFRERCVKGLQSRPTIANYNQAFMSRTTFEAQ